MPIEVSRLGDNRVLSKYSGLVTDKEIRRSIVETTAIAKQIGQVVDIVTDVNGVQFELRFAALGVLFDSLKLGRYVGEITVVGNQAIVDSLFGVVESAERIAHFKVPVTRFDTIEAAHGYLDAVVAKRKNKAKDQQA